MVMLSISTCVYVCVCARLYLSVCLSVTCYLQDVVERHINPEIPFSSLKQKFLNFLENKKEECKCIWINQIKHILMQFHRNASFTVVLRVKERKRERERGKRDEWQRDM